MDARNRDVPVSSVPHTGTPDPAEARDTERAEQAGGGGDRVMQAKATLNRAHILNQRGDGAGCLDAIAEAKRQLAD